MKRKVALVDENICVACGCCVKVCPRSAIDVCNGLFAVVEMNFVSAVEYVLQNVLVH